MGNLNFLKDLKILSSDSVIFGDGVQSKFKGFETLNVPGMPPLKMVLYVEGLASNLISTSQLCDDGLEVQFDKSKCVILKDGSKYIVGNKNQ